MEHESCVIAIKQFQSDPASSNVSNDIKNCKCERKPSPCDWVGNSIQYACLTQEYEHPEKVYGQLNSGGIGRIILPDN